MNYVILNGVKSTLVQGLLIQSLPAISKPLMRTQIEEIDGRDGDVVTNLGYSAYNKSMEIGLFGNYDIDEVIQYFDSEGTVIFSNEPDKFYRYQIIEQIDFERLACFRTATVVFHVQPFKFSAVDDAFTVYKNQLNVRISSSSQYGVTVESANNVITIEGTASRNCEFYVPLIPMTLEAKQYTMQATVNGTGASGCTMRVIENTPTDAETFGGQALSLDGTISVTEELEEEKTYKYIWISIASGTVVDLTLSVVMYDDEFNSFKVFNRGNVIARPTITLYGSGNIVLLVNGVSLFSIALGELEYITLDGLGMNAYKGDVLLNRFVAGDYSKLILKAGSNIVSWTGNVTEVKVENVSRWI